MVQGVWDVYREELRVIPEDVVLALRDAVSRSAVDDFWSIWSRNAEAGLFRAYALAGGPTAAGQLCLSWKRVCYVFVAGVWEAEQLVARARAGYIVLG